MRLRDSIALTLPSFLLRLVLGITFLWAGTGKLVGTMQVSGDHAARLANMGVMLSPVEAAPDPVPVPVPDPPAPDPAPSTDETLEQQAEDIVEVIENAIDEQAPTPTDPADAPTDDPMGDPMGDPSNAPSGDDPAEGAGVAMAWTRVAYASGDRTASDFPQPVQCQRVYSIALMISRAADPGLTADSQPITPIMPPKLADGRWPKILAWSAAITEIVAGAFLIIGLVTRISAFSLFTVMLVAMWMTQFGPAAFQHSDALLGFIPRADDLFSAEAYAKLLWQLSLAAMSLAVVFLGSGAIGLDRIFFPPHARDPYLHGDPKAERKGGMNPATAQRSEFDRSLES